MPRIVSLFYSSRCVHYHILMMYVADHAICACIRVEDCVLVAFEPQASTSLHNLQACDASRQLRMHTRRGSSVQYLQVSSKLMRAQPLGFRWCIRLATNACASRLAYRFLSGPNRADVCTISKLVVHPASYACMCVERVWCLQVLNVKTHT